MSLLSFKWIEMSADGDVIHLSQHEATGRFKKMGVSFFDLRYFDPKLLPVHSGTSGSDYLSWHRHFILARLGNTGVICTEYSLYIADNGGQDLQSLLNELHRRIQFFKAQRVTDDVIIVKFFQTTVLDTILDMYFLRLHARVSHLDDTISPLLHQLETCFDATQFSKLKVFRSRIGDNITILDSLTSVLGKFLEECRTDNTTDDPKQNIQDDLSVLIHLYQVKSSFLQATLDQINSAITESENYFSKRIDAQRNQILKFELIVQTVSFAFILITAVSGLMGMNLDNSLYMPTKKGSFLYITLVTSIASLLVFAISCWYFRRLKLF